MNFEESTKDNKKVDSARVPRPAVRLMIAILVGLSLVAIFGNVQKDRRAEIEQVVITPASTATPAPGAR